MNNDYLWDKSGSDAEIEELESALRNFAYRETPPPALAVTSEVVTFTPKPRVKVFRYAITAAACLLFIAVSFGIWISVSRNAVVNPADDLVAQNPVAHNPNAGVIFEIDPVEKLDDIVAVNPVPHAKKKIVPIARKVRKPATAASEPALTAEELFAYEQLKLALSITGSKLRLVKEKLESHESETVIEDGR